MKKDFTFHVEGMHCKACELMIDSELQELPHIEYARARLSRHMLSVGGDFGEKTAEEVARELSEILAPRGYKVSIEKGGTEKKWKDFKIALPLAAAFALFFVLLQKVGLINLVASGGSMGLGTVFVIGIIASLSSCMAVVGGLLLSMSATFAREGDRNMPMVLFHAGRLISFFIFGGFIGAVGAAFTLSTSATFVLSLMIGIIMLILGINLLDIFPSAKKFLPAMPKWIASRAHDVSKFNHTLTPLLVGIATFFLPCGFTQSMQVYTLTTGNFLEGGLTMLAFALGTLPVLALVSWSSFSIQNSGKKSVFFKTAGLIVILFAVFNLINSLVVVGVLTPVFNF